MLPDGPRTIPYLVAAHGTVLEAAAELAAKEALFGLVEVDLGHARLGCRDAVEDADQDGARERDVEVFDDDEVLVHAARGSGQVGGELPREGWKGVVTVAGVVGCEVRPRRPDVTAMLGWRYLGRMLSQRVNNLRVPCAPSLGLGSRRLTADSRKRDILFS